MTGPKPFEISQAGCLVGTQKGLKSATYITECNRMWVMSFLPRLANLGVEYANNVDPEPAWDCWWLQTSWVFARNDRPPSLDSVERGRPSIITECNYGLLHHCQGVGGLSFLNTMEGGNSDNVWASESRLHRSSTRLWEPILKSSHPLKFKHFNIHILESLV